MLQVTSITRIALSVKFNNGVTRYYDLNKSEWTATP